MLDADTESVVSITQTISSTETEPLTLKSLRIRIVTGSVKKKKEKKCKISPR